MTSNTPDPPEAAGDTTPAASPGASIDQAAPFTPYPDLDAVLRSLVDAQRELLGELLTGVYLQGSFATGGFDRDSDVDLLFVVEHEPPGALVLALDALHGRIHDLDSPWAQHLEGTYMPRAVLRRYEPDGLPLLYLDNGARSLVRSRHCDTHVVRRVTREFGITLYGPDPKTLIDPVSSHDLRDEVRAKLITWADSYLGDPRELANRWDQPYAVLSFCRMVHTLVTGECHSKPAGAEWAMTHLGPEWSDLIRRAWADRPDPSLKIELPADPADVQRTLAFIEYAKSYSGST
jgi:predicted nucleotidyltransferase